MSTECYPAQIGSGNAEQNLRLQGMNSGDEFIVGTDWKENPSVLQILAKFVIQTHPGSHLDPLKEHPQLTLRCWAVLCLCLRG